MSINPEAKDYYERMGLDKNADFSAIKRAYRKCVMKFHPDRNPDDPKAEEKLKRINEAYEVLKDSEQRDIYDKYGEEGLKQGGGGGDGFGFPFSSFFGGGFGGGQQRPKGKQKTESVRQPLPVTLEQLYNGDERKIRVTRSRICAGCNGEGASKKGESRVCPTCNGTGVETKYQQIGPGFMSQVRQRCSRCHGEKRIINKKYLCKKCKGKCVVQEKKTLKIHVDIGMRHGQKIVFEGEADEKPGKKAGDIIFIVQEKKHDVFVRKGHDLMIEKTISLVEALTGVDFLIKHLDGRNLRIRNKPGEVIKPFETKTVKGEGFPEYKRPYSKGNLLISFKIVFPPSIPTEYISKLAAVLPKKKEVDYSKYKELEDCTLINEEVSSAGGRRREVYDSDDEDDGRGGHGETIACSVQ